MLDGISECFHTRGIQSVNEPCLQSVLTNVSKSADFDICSN